MRLLLVEDDTRLQTQLVELLRDAGFAVDVSSDGEEGLYMATDFPVDLAIIDLGLPKLSGLELINSLRNAGKEYPVLILTARSEWQEKVEALDAGADDYVTKPFHNEELLARINALLRRSAGHASSEIQFDSLRVNLSSQKVWVGDQEVELTNFEYKLLEYFVLHPDSVIPKSELNEHLYDEDMDPDSNVLEVVLGRLRKKIDPDGSLKPIETLRGRGYRFALQSRLTAETASV